MSESVAATCYGARKWDVSCVTRTPEEGRVMRGLDSRSETCHVWPGRSYVVDAVAGCAYVVDAVAGCSYIVDAVAGCSYVVDAVAGCSYVVDGGENYAPRART